MNAVFVMTAGVRRRWRGHGMPLLLPLGCESWCVDMFVPFFFLYLCGDIFDFFATWLGANEAV